MRKLPSAVPDPTRQTIPSAKNESSHGFLEGFAGTERGSFFQAPSFVDLDKPPGFTNLETLAPTSLYPVLQEYLTMTFFFYSPNIVWCAIAVGLYVLFPYDLAGAAGAAAANSADASLSEAGSAIQFLLPSRLAVNLAITLAYVGFWHCATHGAWGWSKRSYAKRVYNRSKLLHNVFYTCLGVAQWSFWECAFLACYATGRLPYLPDAEAVGTWPGRLHVAAACLLVPAVRDFHFYFAHRFVHVKFLYKYVHALHHRCADTEPFSGLAMSPTEHLYYFTSYGPLLLSAWVRTTPLALMFCGVHLLFSPAAAHSGFEDHWGSDQYHYLHHRNFECNFGQLNMPFDRWFGTFQGRAEPAALAAAAPADAKATLWGAPDHPWYFFLANLAPGLLCCSALGIALPGLALPDSPRLVASAVAYAPLVVAFGLHAYAPRNRTVGGWQEHFLGQNHRFDVNRPAAAAAKFFFHALPSSGCIVAVYVLVATMLLPPGHGGSCLFTDIPAMYSRC